MLVALERHRSRAGISMGSPVSIFIKIFLTVNENHGIFNLRSLNVSVGLKLIKII